MDDIFFRRREWLADYNCFDYLFVLPHMYFLDVFCSRIFFRSEKTKHVFFIFKIFLEQQ